MLKNRPKTIFCLSFFAAFFAGLFLYSSVLAATVDVTATVGEPVCGNNIVETGEACDGAGTCPAGKVCASCQCTTVIGCIPGPTVCSWGACVAGQQTGSCNNSCSAWSATQNCSMPSCGDGIVDAGEACDDGNVLPNDGCSAVCQNEVGCGNGTLDAGEACDDGNVVAGDCCSDTCEAELIISNITETVTGNSAKITWETACQNTASTLEWGLTVDVSDGSVGGLSGQNYSYTITGLSSGLTYFYKISASAGALSAVQTGSFITQAQAEICDNNLDDDHDALIDIADPDCPCHPSYDCGAWGPETCPANGIQTRTCTKSNNCWNNVPAAEISRSCVPECQLACGPGQNLDLITCQCFDIQPFCGNGICEAPQEDPGNCPQDCQTGCMSEWECTAWEPETCPENGLQTRNCFDRNACPIPVNPEPIEKTCGNLCPGLSCGVCQEINVENCSCIQDLPCCGNSVCEQGESYETCRDDCIAPCTPDWSCSAWGSCANDVKFRECVDLNRCNINLNRPPEVLSCAPNCSVACGQCQQIDIANCRCLDTLPCCGNRNCEEQETTWSCGVDCGIPPSVAWVLPQCIDGIDNDGDGAVDYPADKSCGKPSDNSERTMQETVERVAAGIQKSYKENILENTEVQTINQQIAAPILVTTVAVNAVSSISIFNFASYLRYLFSQPLALVARRRRAKWGVVYNSLTKQPLDLAIVRLYRKEDNRLMQSRVTDKLGRFMIMTEPGDYYITVTKPRFNYPSDFLKDKKEDVKFLDLYHGETIKVTERKANITVNIPVDPTEDIRPVKKLIFQHYLRRLQYAASFASVPLALISVILSPGILTYSLLAFHGLLYILFRRLGYQKPPKSWGIIYDKDNKTPLPRAIARIYDKKYNKLLETRLTDNKGRYSFLVNNNVYYVTTEKIGYHPFRSEEIDLVSKDRQAIVDLDIGLNKQKTGIAGTTEPPVNAPLPTQPNIEEKESQIAAPVPPSTPEPIQMAEPGVGRQTLNDLLKEKVAQRLKEEQAAVEPEISSTEPAAEKPIPVPEIKKPENNIPAPAQPAAEISSPVTEPKPEIAKPEEPKPESNKEKSIFG